MNQINENGKKVHSFYSKCLIYRINGSYVNDITYRKRDKAIGIIWDHHVRPVFNFHKKT